MLLKILLWFSLLFISVFPALAQSPLDDSIMKEVYLDRGFSPIGSGDCWSTIDRTNQNKVIKVCHQKEPGIIEFTYLGYSREEILLTDAIEVDNAGGDLYAASAVRNFILDKIEGNSFNPHYPFETFAQQNSHTGEVKLPSSVVYFSLEGEEKNIKIDSRTPQS